MAAESQDEDGLSISRRKVLQASGAAAVGSVAFTGTASANCPDCADTAPLGKITEDDIDNLCCDGSPMKVTLTLDGDDRVQRDTPCSGHGHDCQGDKSVDVWIAATECKDNSEATKVDITIYDENGTNNCADDGLYLHEVRVKGGPKGEKTYDCDDFDLDSNQCTSGITDAHAPESDNGKLFGISHIELDVCVFADCPSKSTGSCHPDQESTEC